MKVTPTVGSDIGQGSTTLSGGGDGDSGGGRGAGGDGKGWGLISRL